MADNARGIHVSPGVYSKEVDITYAVKSLGITTLGLVGETQRGPAFQPMLIENWRDFQNTFGGTSTEKFEESQYPKYELPYVAKSYLSESNQLQVCRVLGLSGYNAGPAWAITTNAFTYGKETDATPMVIAVIRSRGHYEKYHKYSASTGDCECPSQSYDTLFYEVGETTLPTCGAPKEYNMEALQIGPYIPVDSEGNECIGYHINKATSGYIVGTNDLGHFTLSGFTGVASVGTAPSASTVDKSSIFYYPVSLNPNDKDYILKVLGTTPNDGDAPIYVESLYDVAHLQMIMEGKVTEINSGLTRYNAYHKTDFTTLEPVYDFMRVQEEGLSRRDLGKRVIADKASVEINIHCHPYDYATNKPSGEMEIVKLGQVYTVKQYTDNSGKRHYYYAYYPSVSAESMSQADVYAKEDKLLDGANFLDEKEHILSSQTQNYRALPTLVRVNSDGRYYRIADGDLYPVTNDMNDYRESFRFASTPWIVSNIKGDFNNIELTKLFRFHTISDGNMANKEVKISIQNIKYDDGIFDVVVRDINDTDESVIVLEKFSKCTMVPGDNNYVAYKIGSFDGIYESKSKYITVEVNENLVAQNSIPAGFLGYPLSMFNGLPIVGDKKNVKAPILKYNLNYDEDIKNKRQYFGLSTHVGVDVDSFTYKGHAAYGDEPEYLSQGFHLDSRLNLDSYGDSANTPSITVDGISGYTFDAVSTNNRTTILSETPVIGTESEMDGSIFEMVDLRKFTVYFYGGFDGWDEYRKYRSNTDDFKMSKYKGDYNEYSGIGYAFNRLEDPKALGLNEQGITSDFYAYLAAARQFANPEQVDINVFATPGIDLINNTLLSEEIIDMIEEERADSIYVANIPDKPFGALDYVDEMYTADDIVDELADTEIDSNYTCTYFPWVKYEDKDNNQYIYLPPTKDVVRNMAITDNTAHPWFAPAGLSRGDVNCVRAHYITKLADEDTLYEGRINPVKTFASDGVKLWGQKNLQVRESQLNRIAVRRLLLRMRKLISIACLGLIFDPNDATTKNKFLSTVTPIMDNIKANRGISDYRIEVNDSLESRERRELPAKIYFKPYNALEYIDLTFVVTPESVSFDDI